MHIEKYLNLEGLSGEIAESLERNSHWFLHKHDSIKYFSSQDLLDMMRFSESMARIIAYHELDSNHPISRIQARFCKRLEKIGTSVSRRNRKLGVGGLH